MESEFLVLGHCFNPVEGLGLRGNCQEARSTYLSWTYVLWVGKTFLFRAAWTA